MPQVTVTVTLTGDELLANAIQDAQGVASKACGGQDFSKITPSTNATPGTTPTSFTFNLTPAAPATSATITGGAGNDTLAASGASTPTASGG